MKVIKTLTLAIGGLFVLPTLAHAKEVSPAQTGLAMMRLQASLFSVPGENNTGGSIWTRLRNNFSMAEVVPNLVRSHELKFSNNSVYFNRTINRSTPYMYHITQEVQKRGMPAEIALLPFIESAYVTKARSRVGASGLWQFMPATGRHYGLEQTPLYDGRHDVYAATDAALNYLQYLHGLFGDWTLALAAYNWGEGNMSRAIRRAQEQGLEPTYENLRMPAETRNYVPKLLAVRNLVNNPQAFGLSLPDIANKPYFKAVEVKDPMDIMAAAFMANIPESEFLALNPAFKTPVFIPKGKSRQMLLPISAVKTFEQNYKEADAKTLLSWDVYTPTTTLDLSTIAAQTGNNLLEIKRLNGISGNTVPAGRTILLNKNTAMALNSPFSGSLNDFAKLDYDPEPDTFVEQTPVLTQVQTAALSTPKAQFPVIMPTTTVAAEKADLVQTVAVVTGGKTPDKQTVSMTQTSSTDTFTPTVESIATAQPKPASATIIADTTTQANDDSVQQAQVSTNPSFAAETTKASVSNETANKTTDIVVETKDSKPKDELMALVHESHQRQQSAADAVRESLAKLEVEEAKARALVEAKRLAQKQVGEKARALAESKTQAKADAKKAKGKTATLADVKRASKTEKSVDYKVNSGDTLYSIAKKYDIDVADLVAINGIKGNSIKVGQVLKVVTSQSSAKGKVVKVANKKNADKKAAKVASYTVKKGDTLESIAKRYKLNVGDLKRLNKNGHQLKPGQVVKLSS